MIGDMLPEQLVSVNQARQKLREYRDSSRFPVLRRFVPRLFGLFINVKYPFDIWIIRDLIFREGHELQETETKIEKAASELGEDFLRRAFDELGDIRDVDKLVEKLNSIGSELTCALSLRGLGATHILKGTTPEDISCCLRGAVRYFQVKRKEDEEFDTGLIEEALFGAMHSPENESLRDFRFEVMKCVKVHDGYRQELIQYIHDRLSSRLGASEADPIAVRKMVHQGRRLTISLQKIVKNGVLLDSIGKDKYDSSVVSIRFRKAQPDEGVASPAKVIGRSEEFSEDLRKHLHDKIADIAKRRAPDETIGWIQLELTYQYEGYLVSKEGRNWLIQLLNSTAEFPLVLHVHLPFAFCQNKYEFFFLNKPAQDLAFLNPLTDGLAVKL